VKENLRFSTGQAKLQRKAQSCNFEITNYKLQIQKEYPSPSLILPLPLGGGSVGGGGYFEFCPAPLLSQKWCWVHFKL